MARFLLIGCVLLAAAIGASGSADAQGACQCRKQVATASAAGTCSIADLQSACTITFTSSRGNAQVADVIRTRDLTVPYIQPMGRSSIDPVTDSMAFLGQRPQDLRLAPAQAPNANAFAGSIYIALVSPLIQAQQNPGASSDPVLGSPRTTELLRGIRDQLMVNAQAVTTAFIGGPRWEGRTGSHLILVRAFFAEVRGEELTLQVRSPFAAPD